jgi:2-keto-4-pentenoate hydratase
MGTPLKSGQFILLGSIVETKWVNKGDLVEIEIDKLGKASVEFT